MDHCQWQFISFHIFFSRFWVIFEELMPLVLACWRLTGNIAVGSFCICGENFKHCVSPVFYSCRFISWFHTLVLFLLSVPCPQRHFSNPLIKEMTVCCKSSKFLSVKLVVCYFEPALICPAPHLSVFFFLISYPTEAGCVTFSPKSPSKGNNDLLSRWAHFPTFLSPWFMWNDHLCLNVCFGILQGICVW